VRETTEREMREKREREKEREERWEREKRDERERGNRREMRKRCDERERRDRQWVNQYWESTKKNFVIIFFDVTVRLWIFPFRGIQVTRYKFSLIYITGIWNNYCFTYIEGKSCLKEMSRFGVTRTFFQTAPKNQSNRTRLMKHFM
jgi:hypothetical protein